MDSKRLVLYFALAFLVFSLWTDWLKDYPKTVAPAAGATVAANQTVVPSTQVSAAANVPSTAAAVPAAAVPTTPQQAAAAKAASQTPAERIVEVHTDVLNVKIDTLGGNIISASLPKYPAEIKTPNIPVTLLTDNPDTFYVAETGITGPQGPDTQQGQVQYKAAQQVYTLPTGEKELEVPLTYKNEEGLVVTKTFRFQAVSSLPDQKVAAYHTGDARIALDPLATHGNSRWWVRTSSSPRTSIWRRSRTARCHSAQHLRRHYLAHAIGLLG